MFRMPNSVVAPVPHVPPGFDLEPARVGRRVRHEVFVADWYKLQNEDLAIVTVKPRLEDTFEDLTTKLLKFFTDVHQVRVSEIQPCALGHAYVRFSSSVEREMFIGPEFHFDKYVISVSKHDEGFNAQSFDLDREAWFMLVGFPEDLRNDAGLARGVSTFGMLVDWEITKILSRVIVKVYLKVDAEIPDSVLVQAGVPRKGRSWIVDVFHLKKKVEVGFRTERALLPIGRQSSLPSQDVSGNNQFLGCASRAYEGEGRLQSSGLETRDNNDASGLIGSSTHPIAGLHPELNISYLDMRAAHVAVTNHQEIDGNAATNTDANVIDGMQSLLTQPAGEKIGSSADGFGASPSEPKSRAVEHTPAVNTGAGNQDMNNIAERSLALRALSSPTLGGRCHQDEEDLDMDRHGANSLSTSCDYYVDDHNGVKVDDDTDSITPNVPNHHIDVKEPECTQRSPKGKGTRQDQERQRKQAERDPLISIIVVNTSDDDSHDVILAPKPIRKRSKKRRAKKHREPMDADYCRRSKRLAGKQNYASSGSAQPKPLAIVLPRGETDDAEDIGTLG